MAYCTQSEIETACGGAERLRHLVDWDTDGAIDTATLDTVIAKVSRWIDSYARARHSVPFADDEVPTEIRDVCADEVVFRLRRARKSTDQDDADGKEQRIAWLSKLARGVVRITIESNKPAQAATAETGELASATGEFDSPDFGGLW